MGRQTSGYLKCPVQKHVEFFTLPEIIRYLEEEEFLVNFLKF